MLIETKKVMGLSRLITFISIISALFFAASWLWPVHQPPWQTFYQESFAFVSAFLFSTASFILFKDKVKNKYFLLLCIISISPVFTIFLHPGRYFLGNILLPVLYLAVFSMTYLASASVSISKFKEVFFNRFCCLVLAVCLVSSILSIMQKFSLTEYSFVMSSSVRRPYANIGQPNILSTLLFFGIYSLAYLYGEKKISKYPAAMFVIMLLLSLAMTQSRTAILVSVVNLIIVFKFMRQVNSSLGIKRILSLTAVFLLLFLCLPSIDSALLLDQENSLMSRLTNNPRKELYIHFLNVLMESPIIGYGWGNIGFAQFQNVELYPIQQRTYYSHNIILDFFLWGGILIGLPIIAILGYIAYSAVNSIDSHEKLIALLSLSALAMHSLLEYPYAYSFVLLPAAVFLGFLLPSRKVNSKEKLNIPSGKYFILALVIVSLVVIYEYYKIKSIYKNNVISSAGVIGYQTVKVENVIFLDNLSELTNLVFYKTNSYSVSEEVLVKTALIYPSKKNLDILQEYYGKNNLEGKEDSVGRRKNIYYKD